MELRGPHTIHHAQCLPPRCCQEKRLQCPVKPTLSKFSKERMAEGQSLMPLCDHLSLITCSPFSVGNSDPAPIQGRSAVLLSAPPRLGKLSSFRPLGHEDYGSILFGKSRICLVDWCPPVGLQRCHSTSSFCFAEDMRGVVPETLKSEEDPCRAVLHLLLKHFNLLPVFSPPTCLSCTCLFPSLLCLHVLTLPHPVGSQHHATPKLNSWHEGESS